MLIIDKLWYVLYDGWKTEPPVIIFVYHYTTLVKFTLWGRGGLLLWGWGDERGSLHVGGMLPLKCCEIPYSDIGSGAI